MRLWFLSLYSIRSGIPFKTPFEPKDIQPLFLREAELKHGRLAMVAALLIPLSEMNSHTLGINQFQALPNEIQCGIIALMFMSECRTLHLGWEPKKLFTIREKYIPGDFRIGIRMPHIWYMDSELNHGRLAMLGVLGMMTQELVTQLPLFPN